MVRFHIDCVLPFPREQFWRIRDSPSFFEFIVEDGLLKDLKATQPQYDDDGWATRVQHYCPANVDCPNMIRAVVGDTLFEVSDEQRWNEKERPCHLQFFIKPSFLSGLSRTSGELSIEHFETTGTNITDNEATMSDQSASGSENDSRSSDSATDLGSSDSSDSSSDLETFESPEEYIERLSSADKSRHVVSGETRVNILTLGWFVERAIVHNLRMFYRQYPSTIARFRQRLYRDFAGNDDTVPIHMVVERFLEKEQKRKHNMTPKAADDCRDTAGLGTEPSLYDIKDCNSCTWDEEFKGMDGTRSPTGLDQDLESLMQPA